MRQDQLAMQEQLRAAEHKTAATEARLAAEKQQRQQVIAACQPILAWVSTCLSTLTTSSEYIVCSDCSNPQDSALRLVGFQSVSRQS